MPQTILYNREQPLPGSWRYSVIRKAAMALSGIALVAFLYGHWNGNRALLDGENNFNAYLAWLQGNPMLHYGVWIIIATALLVHLLVGIHHWYHNRRARPVPYRHKSHLATTWAARSMIVSGAILLLFLIVHIAQVRGWAGFDSGGVYRNMQAGFENGPVVAIYLLAQLALALHLYHGLWSLLQTLGISHPRYNQWRRPLAAVVGIGIALLNIALVLLNLDFIDQLPGGVA